MGVPHLNRTLRNKCSEGIQQIDLSELEGKKIAIDASIYMYRYLADDNLLEGMFLMMSTLCDLGIIPILVFDGKPPVEKEDVLQKRRARRQKALAECAELQEALDALDEDDENRQKLENELDKMRRASVKIKTADVAKVKELAVAMSISFRDSEGEADVLCAQLVNKKFAYACLSEDMDMFVFGCKRVLRYLSLISGTVVLYTLETILDEIQMSQGDFTKVCVLSGTDYNRGENSGKSISLETGLKLYAEYKASKQRTDFYVWLEENASNLVSNIYSLYSVAYMFDLTNYNCPKGMHDLSFCNGPICIDNVRRVLEPVGFVFVE